MSRLTVRKAISVLVDEGLLMTKKGMGIYVKNLKINFEMNHVKGFNEMLHSQGFEYERKLIKHEVSYPPNHILESLGLEPGIKLHTLHQLFLMEGKPIGLLVTYISPDTGFTDELAEKMDQASFLEVLKEDLNIIPFETRYSIDATAAPSELTSILNVSLGYPLLKVERTTLTEENILFESTVMYLSPNLYQFKFDIRNNNSNTNDGPPQKLYVHA